MLGFDVIHHRGGNSFLLVPLHYGTETGQIETKPLLLFNLVNFHPILLKLGTKVTYNPQNEKKKIFKRAVTIF